MAMQIQTISPLSLFHFPYILSLTPSFTSSCRRGFGKWGVCVLYIFSSLSIIVFPVRIFRRSALC
ncbi:hypothetical protein M408DRAFT_188939 [Serendipita vermifera MAFF 305830]|uniref:Uncharacterized protein n=1 Tax=Serendipita vermifera MAFF 305830 TaxID=933852 RepID=A0A0C3BLH4_SERVB|nr:hypothetical protein M408DRAFT_188939 [Serendipita vermifera MAFF 305830]